MPPKRSAPSRGSQSVQNSGSKPPLPEKVVNEAPAKQMVATTFVPLAPVIPLGSPFENHLNHAKKLYKDKATMIVNVQKKRVIAAKRLKKLQLANIEAQFNFEMTQAVSQSEKAIELLNTALTEYVSNTARAKPPSTSVDINGSVFNKDSNPFELTAAGQIPNSGVLSSRHHKVLMQAQAQAAAAAAYANGSGSGSVTSRSRITRGSKADKDSLSDYASDSGTAPIPTPEPAMSGHHTHITCASAFLTTSSNIMKRYQQLLLETKENKDTKNASDGVASGGSRKRGSERGSAGQSSSMYLSASVPHFFNQTITQPLDDANCRSDMLSIITAMKNSMTGPRSAPTAVGTNNATADMEVDAEVKTEVGVTSVSTAASAGIAPANDSNDGAIATQTDVIATSSTGTSTGPCSAAEMDVKRFKSFHPTLALVRTSDRHIQVDTSVFYCGSYVDVYVCLSNDRLPGVLITAVTPTEIIIKAKNGVRRSFFINQIVNKRVVLSASDSI